MHPRGGGPALECQVVPSESQTRRHPHPSTTPTRAPLEPPGQLVQQRWAAKWATLLLHLPSPATRR